MTGIPDGVQCALIVQYGLARTTFFLNLEVDVHHSHSVNWVGFLVNLNMVIIPYNGFMIQWQENKGPKRLKGSIYR